MFERTSLWWPFLAGVLFYFAFPPAAFWPLAFVSMVPFFFFLERESSWRRLVLGSYIFLFTYSAAVGWFIFDPLLYFLGALVWSAIFFPFLIIFKVQHVRPAVLIIGMALAFSAAEYAVGEFSLLPAFITMPGLPMAGTPFQFVALLGGFLGTNIFVSLINALGALFVLHRQQGERSRWIWVTALLVLLLAALPLRFLASKNSLPFKVMTIATGPQFDSALKRMDDSAFATTEEGDRQIKTKIQALLAPIGQKVDEVHPELVIFPEEMLDIRLPGVADPQAEQQVDVTNSGPLLEEYSAFAVIHRVSLMETLVTFDREGKKYISTIAIDKKGNFTGIYHKRYLTIVGEYWPFGNWLPFWWRWSLERYSPSVEKESFITDNPTGPFTRGVMSQEPLRVGGVEVGPLICLEGHYPELFRQWQRGGVAFMVYGGSNVWLVQGLYEYRALSMKIRQIESIATGLSVAVAGAEEKPAVILPDGTVTQNAVPLPARWTYVTN